MPAIVYRKDKPPREVKNLGWILRHWKEVEYLGFNYCPNVRNTIDGEFIAKLRDGSSYITDYASISVCFNFVNRPVFKTLEFRICDLRNGNNKPPRVFIIGNDEFKRVNKLPYHEQMKVIAFRD